MNPLEIAPGVTLRESEFQFSFARSSAPGGQNVNKVNSKAVLRFDLEHSPSIGAELRARLRTRLASRLTTLGELVVHADEFRDQKRNMEACVERLVTMLRAAAHVPRTRRATRPGRGAVERRLGEKRHHAERKRSRSRGHDD